MGLQQQGRAVVHDTACEGMRECGEGDVDASCHWSTDGRYMCLRPATFPPLKSTTASCLPWSSHNCHDVIFSLAMVLAKTLDDQPVHSRVKLEWKFESRVRHFRESRQKAGKV